MQGIGQYLAHIIYKSCPENDLQLVSRNKHTLYKIYILNSVNVRLVVILQHKAQTCGTVCDPKDIAFAARKTGEF